MFFFCIGTDSLMTVYQACYFQELFRKNFMEDFFSKVTLYYSASQSGVPWTPKSGTIVLSSCIFEQLQLGKKVLKQNFRKHCCITFMLHYMKRIILWKSIYYNMHLLICYLKSHRYMFVLVYLYDSCVGKYTLNVLIRFM